MSRHRTGGGFRPPRIMGVTSVEDEPPASDEQVRFRAARGYLADRNFKEVTISGRKLWRYKVDLGLDGNQEGQELVALFTPFITEAEKTGRVRVYVEKNNLVIDALELG